MTAQLRAREVLLPVLLLPMAVPVLLASVRLTEGALVGEDWAVALGWWQLLAGFDVVFLVAGYLTFEFVLEA
jgi:heme exporter protein B